MYIRPMSIEVLNTELISELIKKRGWKRTYVIEQLGLSRDGYKFLRGEWIPKDKVRKTRLLKTLANLLNVEVSQILLRLEARQKQPA